MTITFSKLGGYGWTSNQLFQWLALKGISHKTGHQFKIPQGTDLEKEFNIQCEYITDNDLKDVEYLYQEPYFPFNEAVFQMPDKTEIEGYFQSYKYFDFLPKTEILKELTLKNPGDVQNLITTLQQTKNILVGLHVRRGNYLDPRYSTVHPFCGLDYYKKAINLIVKKYGSLENILFVICSDDIKWCEENLSFLPNVYYSTERTGPQDQWLMSLCDHNIIANSSFSWLSAWLNTNPNKTVVYPSVWFGVNDKDHDTSDLCLPSWIKI